MRVCRPLPTKDANTTIMRPEKITILNDEKMKEKGFRPLTLKEKIYWVTKQLNKEKSRLVDLKKNRYHIDDPTTMPIKGDDSMEAKWERATREARLTSIDRKIYRTNVTIEEYQLRLDEYNTMKAADDLKALRGEHGAYIKGQDSDNIKKGAIRLVVESVKKQKICNYALERYIELHVKGRDISKIYQQIHEENNEVPERSFYNWVEKYENTLKALGYAQEN